MRNLGILLFVLILSTAPPLTAGAWLREKGATFTSLSFTTNWYYETGQTTFFEYGLRDDITIGVDIAMGLDRFGVQSGTGTAFVRRPLRWGDSANVWAYEIGAGASWSGERITPHLKTGLSWGRGLTLRDMAGWTAVDTSIKWDLGNGAHVAKVDGTLGFNFTENTTGMLQIYLMRDFNGSTGTLAPSVVYRPGESKFRIQVGVETPFGRARDTAIKLGLWREF